MPHEDTAELIGRTKEREELAALIVEHAVVFVYGAIGVGKTALTREVVRLESAARRIPPAAYASLAGASEARDVLERTAASLDERPPAVDADHVPRAIFGLLEAQPRTLIWDDIHDASVDAIAAVVRELLSRGGPSRLVLVSRRFFPARTRNIRLPVLQVQPLAPEDGVRLVRALEAARGRSLAEDVATSAGHNPLLVKLALARGPAPASEGAEVAFRWAVTEHAHGAAKAALEILLAAAQPLAGADLEDAVGAGARDAIERLRQHLVVIKEGSTFAIAPPLLEVVRAVIGEPGPERWRALLGVAERALAASPTSPAALLLVCRARVALGDAGGALATMRTHLAARAAAGSASLERVLRDAARVDPPHAAAAVFMLAREQIRSGDYDAARRTADEMPHLERPRDKARLRLLRSEALARGGDPIAAREELSAPELEDDDAMRVAWAELDFMGGDLEKGRKALLRLGARTKKSAGIELRRSSALAASYFFEGRYDEAVAWVQKARSVIVAQPGSPVESVVTIVDVLSLLGLDHVDRAVAVLARDGREGREAPLLRAALDLRRGDLRGALEEGAEGLRALGRHADVVFRTICARDIARACVGLGQIERAREILRLASGTATAPGFGVLAGMVHSVEAEIARVLGDAPAARKAARLAETMLPRSPFVAIERALASGRARGPRAPRPRGEAVRAYESLRTAEVLLQRGAPADVQGAATRAADAERAYRGRGLEHDLARALVARAEAQARLGRAADAHDALASVEGIADARGYVLVAVHAALIRAHLADRAGDLRAYVRAIARARDRANGLVRDVGLARACERVGLAPPAAGAAAAPWTAIVQRLELDRPCESVWMTPGHVFLLAARELPPEPFALVLDLDEGVAWSPRARTELPRQRLRLLEMLVEVGDAGASIEELYSRLWQGPPYHPLRHRNTVYVALTRLRASLEPVVGADALLEQGDSRYRLAARLRVAVRRAAAPARVALGTRERRDEWPLAFAQWEAALADS